VRGAAGGAVVSRLRTIVVGQRSPSRVDGLTILGCEPERVVADQEQEVSVVIVYDLKSAEHGEINLGFNADDPNAFKIVTSKIVDKGKGQVVLTARVTPRYWGEHVFFKAYANLSEHPHTTEWAPLANDAEPLEVAAP
jgi:hypothetical protein